MKGNVLILVSVLFLTACGKDNDLKGLVLDPTAATLIFPENVSQCFEGNLLSSTESEVTFRWNSSENIDRYELHLTNLADGTTEVFGTTNTDIPIRILRGVPYSWFIMSFHINSNNVNKSSIWSFYNAGEAITSYIPFPASAIEPLPGEALDNITTVTLSWEAMDLDNDIASYDLYFGITAIPEIYSADITASSVSGIPVNSNTDYYWKITTTDLSGNKSVSNLFSFRVN